MNKWLRNTDKGWCVVVLNVDDYRSKTLRQPFWQELVYCKTKENPTYEGRAPKTTETQWSNFCFSTKFDKFVHTELFELTKTRLTHFYEIRKFGNSKIQKLEIRRSKN